MEIPLSQKTGKLRPLFHYIANSRNTKMILLLKTFQSLTITALLCTLTACTESAAPPPACHGSLQHAPAKSAGCLAIHEGKLLVVQEITGKVNIPGGSGNPHEPAHCNAQRETWEETGLTVQPIKLIRVFDNGFHLFECTAELAELPSRPPFYAEIRQAIWLSGSDFELYQWRFPEQRDWLKQYLPQPGSGDQIPYGLLDKTTKNETAKQPTDAVDKPVDKFLTNARSALI